MNKDELKAALEAMAKEREQDDRSLRKPTPTEVRQSRAKFEIYPQEGIPSFTLGCLYCNTGYEDDYYAARVGERMMAFFGRHKGCTPGCLPPRGAAMISECKHYRTAFITDERGPAGRRAHAYVCKDCGLFVVGINGERVMFALVTDEQVEAAGKYAAYLKASEG